MTFDAASIMSLIGTSLSAFGQYQESQDAQRISEYNARVALRNAKLIRQGAALELTRGKKQKATTLAKQRVMFAKAGVRFEGTPFDVLVESASNLELDLQIDYFNSQVAADREIMQSQVDTAQASAYGRQKYMRPIGTVLSSKAFRNVLTPKEKAGQIEDKKDA